METSKTTFTTETDLRDIPLASCDDSAGDFEHGRMSCDTGARAFPTLRFAGQDARHALVQGGMGSRLSNGEMAGQVAAAGGYGTVTAVQYEQGKGFTQENGFETARDRMIQEIRYAKSISPCGIGINAMAAQAHCYDYVSAALAEGIDHVIMGAGFPRDLAKLMKDAPDVAMIGIVAGYRATRSLVSAWMRNGRTPSALVYESPRYAGGHLGSKMEDVAGLQHSYRAGLAEVFAALRDEAEKQALPELAQTPVIAAGGIASRADADYIFSITNEHGQRVAGIQIATPFLTTDVSAISYAGTQDDVDNNKQLVATHLAKSEIGLIESTAKGLPGRVLMNAFIAEQLAVLRGRQKIQKQTFKLCVDCVGGNCNIGETQWCIPQRLNMAVQGLPHAALVFTGRRPQHRGAMTVQEVMKRYLD